MGKRVVFVVVGSGGGGCGCSGDCASDGRSEK